MLLAFLFSLSLHLKVFTLNFWGWFLDQYGKRQGKKFLHKDQELGAKSSTANLPWTYYVKCSEGIKISSVVTLRPFGGEFQVMINVST